MIQVKVEDESLDKYGDVADKNVPKKEKRALTDNSDQKHLKVNIK